MHRVRRASATIAATTLIAATLTLTGPVATAAGPAGRDHHSHESARVVLDWERIAFRTVYFAYPDPVGTTPVPQGVPVLGFTSMALLDAARASEHRHHSSETAAVAQAAHDVLLAYYPVAEATLAADLAASLDPLPDGRAKDRGIEIGRQAAADMIASRVGDHFKDPAFHYSKTPGPGVWQPNPGATDMLVPWLGSLTPLVLHRPVRVHGPDRLTSHAYARDFNEVKKYGGLDSTARSSDEKATALFFNSNSATMVGDALVRHLAAHPMRLGATALLFARIHAAMTDSAIRCWQLKRDVGFWRPSQAIAGADGDGNPDTSTEAGWVPLVPNPNYSDYLSGHASLTAPAIETIRRTLGEHTPLELISIAPGRPPISRTYLHLSEIERDAFNARIWSGLHFRRAMTDGYYLGHRTARKVMAELR